MVRYFIDTKFRFFKKQKIKDYFCYGVYFCIDVLLYRN